MDLSQGDSSHVAWGLKGSLVNLLTMPKTGAEPYPVPPVDVSPMAHQQLHHVRLVSQDSDVQGCVVGNRV